MSRTLTPKDPAYESIANDSANYIPDFDIARRLKVPVHTLLGELPFVACACLRSVAAWGTLRVNSCCHDSGY
jgi:hypothetical protein